MTRTHLQAAINSLPWWHQIDFGEGVLAPGVIKSGTIRRMERAIFAFADPLGKTVLDVGCWDGAYSIAASRRGAARVLATDHCVWNEGWGDRRSFELARDHLAPTVEALDIPVEEISAERLGCFDIIMFLGVFYHLRHPFAELERIAPMVRETLILESRMTGHFNPRPVLQFHPGALDGDASNWWTPNRACVRALLTDLGFTQVRVRHSIPCFRRALFHARR